MLKHKHKQQADKIYKLEKEFNAATMREYKLEQKITRLEEVVELRWLAGFDDDDDGLQDWRAAEVMRLRSIAGLEG